MRHILLLFFITTTLPSQASDFLKKMVAANDTLLSVEDTANNPRRIKKVKIIFRGIIDNKDKEESMNFFVYKQSVLVGSLTNIGSDVVWQEGTSHEWEIPISQSIDESNRNILKIKIQKGNECEGNPRGCGFEFSSLQVIVTLSDGSKQEWASLERTRMGDNRETTIELWLR